MDHDMHDRNSEHDILDVSNVLEEKFQKLFQVFQTNQHKDPSSRKTLKFSNIANHISCNYFYETAAQFDSDQRLKRFFDSSKIGDKFIAKVMHVFKHSAEVLLVWSPKRNVRDLKIKANLRLFPSSVHKTLDKKMADEWNIDVSELIFVEIVQLDKKNRKIELIRCHQLSDKFEDLDEIGEDSLKNGKYRIIDSAQTSFHDYMMDHNDLRNPSLIKLYPFTSLMNSHQIIQCRKQNNKTLEIESKMNQPDGDHGKTIEKAFDDNSSRTLIDKRLMPKSKTNSRHTHSANELESSSYSSSEPSSKHRRHSKHATKQRDSRRHNKTEKRHSKKKKSKHRKNHRGKSSSSPLSTSSSSSSSSTKKSRKSKRKHKQQDKIDDKILKLLKFA